MLILGLPLLAYGGYIRASIELSEASQSNPITILELISNSNFTTEIGEKIVSLSDMLQFLVYPSLLCLFVGFYFIRNVLEKRFNSIQVQYTDGTSINVSRYFTNCSYRISCNICCVSVSKITTTSSTTTTTITAMRTTR